MRRELDRYYTPRHAVESLLRHYDIGTDSVLEPCSGQGHISRVLETKGYRVRTNDIDESIKADSHDDATSHVVHEQWQNENSHYVVISNPPFKHAASIVNLSSMYQNRVAMLLRLSFLEPCANRVELLQSFPPDLMIVLPRISFTGDGKTDSVTCAWMIWDIQSLKKGIIVEPSKSARQVFQDQ